MPKKSFKLVTWFRSRSRRKKIFIVCLAAAVLFLGYLIFRPKAQNYQPVTVTRGSIAETVSVTGNTTPVSSVALGFANSGTVASVDASVGQTVGKGQVLASLNTGDLYAQLKQANAALATQKANYQKLVNGATGAAIDVARAAVAAAQTSLGETVKQQQILVANAYRQLLNVDTSLSLSSGIPQTAPTISGTYIGTTEGAYEIRVYSSGGSGYFAYSGLESGTGQVNSVAPVALGTKGLYLSFPPNFSSNTSNVWVLALPNKQAASYLTSYNAYQLALQTQSQAVAAAQSSLDQANAALTQTSTTARPEDIAAAQASVDSAAAGVQSIQSKLQNSKILAPISGVITQFDAKVGQFAAPGTTLVSIISNGSFEIDALVSETDVGKIAVGNKVAMTLDAFPGETFTGAVFYIDPAQTSSGGVVGYKIKVSFDAADARMKSGLTANLSISTREKDSVLTLPQYAILQNDDGAFVEVLENGKVKDMPVTLGLQDQNGNVEIISGVTEGEQVLNIGLKQK
jgi:HlyD family secretion protein